jgi:hypothetical protein
MKVALITPFDLLDLAAVSSYHLLLPQYFDNKRYREFYDDAVGFKILDNGANENYNADFRELTDMGHAWDVNEIVVPDVLGDAQATIDLARSFERYAQPDRFHYVGVAQGRTLAEVIKCINYYHVTEWITTLALPRVLNTIHKTQRFNLIEPIAKEYDFGAIHCLGGSSWVREVVAIDALGLVRGMDTSLPIVLGLDGKSLADDQYISRQADYFDRVVERSSLTWKVIDDNVRKFFDWAGAGYGTETPTGEL